MKLKQRSLNVSFIVALSLTLLLGVLFSFNPIQLPNLSEHPNDINLNPISSDYDQFRKGNFTG